MIHNIDNIAFRIGNFSLHWYAVMFILSFAIVSYLLRKQKFLSSNQQDNIFALCIIGVIVGGRLGEVLFYNPSFYFSHPLEIFKVWKGGMSFHGGLLGVIIASFLACRYYRVNFLQFTDIISPLIPIGLFLGRIGNFINGELYGKPCTYEWCMVFPKIDSLTRHPSQLYQAALEGILLFIILYFYRKKSRPLGTITGLFLLGYGVARMIGELFKTPDAGILSDWTTLSMGQWLCLPQIILGLYLLIRASSIKRSEDSGK